MAETARASVTLQRPPPLGQSHRPRRFGMEDPIDDVDFDEVVTGAERPQLRPAALACRSRHGAGIAAVDATVFFSRREVPGGGETLPFGPACALAADALELLVLEGDAALHSHAARTVGIQRVRQPRQLRLRLLEGKLAGQQPDAAVDVVADRPRGDDPVRQPGGRHTADGEAVALMDV